MPNAIVNAAAHGAYSWQGDVDRMIAVNLRAVVALVDAASLHGVGAFVQLCSSSEYGYRDHAASELDRLAPNSAYAITKADVLGWLPGVDLAQWAQRAHRVHGRAPGS